AAALAAASAVVAQEPEPARCAAPAELIEDSAKLPALGELLRARQPIKIVAIGGSSTAGLAAEAFTLAYPARLQEVLQQRHSDVPITVVNKGAPRETTQEMLDRFDKDVFAEAPVLVIWETGTTDAVRGIKVEDFAAALESGIAQLRSR